MNKVVSNTFHEGMVMDLNPLTTPNNVLTDCLNGTLITFNGDELTLQNDTGNVTVKYKEGTEDEEEVTLPEGYTPVAIKEYAGVLYILSVDKTNQRVQIGSFPSPNYITNTKSSKTITVTSLDNEFALTTDSVYPGDTISISGTETIPNLDVSKLGLFSCYDTEGNFLKRLYNFSVFIKTSSGSIDLSEEFGKQAAPDLWFMGGTFYSDKKYSGRLFGKITLEDIDYFNVSVKQYVGTIGGESRIVLGFDSSYATSSTLKITSYTLTYTYKDYGRSSDEGDYPLTITGTESVAVGGVAVFTNADIIGNEDSSITYTITPVFAYEFNNELNYLTEEENTALLNEYSLEKTDLLLRSLPKEALPTSYTIIS